MGCSDESDTIDLASVMRRRAPRSSRQLPALENALDPTILGHFRRTGGILQLGLSGLKAPQTLGRVIPADENDAMHANRTLIPLLIVASLAVDLYVIASLSRQAKWPDEIVALAMGLAAGQINLVTLWGVLGHGRLPWRIVGLLAVPIAWGFAIFARVPNVLPAYTAEAVWGVHFLTQTVLLASILFLVRLRGALLLPQDFLSTRPATRRMQFTLRCLFAWLTSTAVALSLLKATFDQAALKETDFDWSGILGLGLSGVAIGLASAWPVLDARARFSRFVATVVTAVPLIAVVAAIGFLVDDADIFTGVSVLLFAAGTYSAVAWAVLRTGGYRIAWLSAQSPPSPERPADNSA